MRKTWRFFDWPHKVVVGSKPAADAAKSPLPFPVPGDRVELPSRANEWVREKKKLKNKKKEPVGPGRQSWTNADGMGEGRGPLGFAMSQESVGPLVWRRR